MKDTTISKWTQVYFSDKTTIYLEILEDSGGFIIRMKMLLNLKDEEEWN